MAVELALVLPRYPDGTYAFQRRDANAPTSSNELGLFGGHFEPGEDAAIAIEREFAEEVTFPSEPRFIYNSLVKNVEVPKGFGGHEVTIIAHLFGIDIPDEVFEVHEGAGTERYDLEVALHREDMAKTARFVLNKYLVMR